MKLNQSIKLLATFALIQSACGDTMLAAQKKGLSSYVEKAKQQEEKKDENLSGLGTSLVLATGGLWSLCPATNALGHCSNQAAAFAAITTASTILLLANLELQNYITKAPTGFRESLEKLNALIDPDKAVFIGSKEYVVAKDFNNIEKTKYKSINTQQNGMTLYSNVLLTTLDVGQYEIYLMPDSKNLVATFDTVTQALVDFKDDIAFIAIRPTPVLTNDIKQILPRIVIVLNEKTNKNTAEKILCTTYHATAKILNLKSTGNTPRYSEQVNFAHAALINKNIALQSLIFVGMGNTDFKQQYPNQFERKKFLGIIRHGDMAYPVNTPETEKISTIIIGK